MPSVSLPVTTDVVAEPGTPNFTLNAMLMMYGSSWVFAQMPSTHVLSLLEFTVTVLPLNWKLPVGTVGAVIGPVGVQAAMRPPVATIDASAIQRRTVVPRMVFLPAGAPRPRVSNTSPGSP
jgi:hypothetical protein